MVEEILKNIFVGVLQGGVSSERDISFQSGSQVISSLQRSGIRAAGIDISTRDRETVKNLILEKGIDCAFIALHGEFGEDGQIQKILEEINIPYTGSGPEASYKAMDKAVSKEVFLKNSVPTPEFEVLNRGSFPSDQWQCPFVIKPHLSGSSVGVSIVNDKKDLAKALEAAFAESEKVLIEEYIKGRECTVGILDSKPMGVVEIVPKTGYYDFKAKYTDGMTRFIVPADIPYNICRKIRDTGAAAHNALGCADFSRVDIRLSEEGVPYVLEVNSIPGLTSHSLLPLSASCRGIDFDTLMKTMLTLCLKKRGYQKERKKDHYGAQRQT